MTSLVPISFASDTVSTQQIGISVHTSQCISTHNPFGLHAKSPASKLLYHIEPNTHEALIQQRNYHSIKRGGKKIQCMVTFVDNLAQSSGSWIWTSDQGALVSPSSGVPSTLQSLPVARALNVEVLQRVPWLEQIQMSAAPLDEDTQVTSGLETSPGQQLCINTHRVLEGRRGSCWRQAVIQTSC